MFRWNTHSSLKLNQKALGGELTDQLGYLPGATNPRMRPITATGLAAVYPETPLQTWIVHLIPIVLDFANWKERKPMATALRPIYTAAGPSP